MKLTLGQLVLINSVVVIAFMIINSFICGDGETGAQCVKRLDDRIFTIQMIANLVFAWYYIQKIDTSKWKMFLFNLFLLAIIYLVAGTLHSISKGGLF